MKRTRGLWFAMAARDYGFEGNKIGVPDGEKTLTAIAANGVGSNGVDRIPELEKANPTLFHGSILLSARQHGYCTAELMHKWIMDGKEMPLDSRTPGTLITRDTFGQILKDEGITD